MLFNKNRIFVALVTLGLPLASFAASNVVVPPPAQPGASANAPESVAVPAKSPTAASASVGAAPAVLPPTTAKSVNPAAAVQSGGPVSPPPLIDIALPAAPKPEPVVRKGAAGDLKPIVPGTTAKKHKASKKNEGAGSSASHAKPVIDPFSGVVGTPVSDSQLNRFVFPEPIEGVFFQEGAPLPECPEKANELDPCRPVFLNGKRIMLLQLRAGAKGPVQMLVHLKSGRITTLNLMPAAGPGAIVRMDGAEDGASDTRLAEGHANGKGASTNTAGMAASEENVETLSRFARGDIPAGFEPVAVDGKPVRFELFEVIQQATWDNGAGLRAHLFQVKAYGATPVAISPALFRQENVKALALDRETITNKEPALLYMLELVPTENN